MMLFGHLILWFIALYPPVTGAYWMAGGLLHHLLEPAPVPEAPSTGWPGVTVLIPAYNEAAVIGLCVQAALALDYPGLEVIVLDDGSTDDTAAAALAAAGGDPRLRVASDGTNLGKAERLNAGLGQARHELVLVCDADTHLHPLAPKLLVTRMLTSELNVAVAGAPHVSNRRNLLCAMQVLEAASIIGLIRRTSGLRGRVGTVAGVLALLRRDAILAVGGYRGRMATEDIDLTWRLLMEGWHTVYEPAALIGMQVPGTLKALWLQRKRWARGQGEVLHEHFLTTLRRRHFRMWPVVFESVASLIWVVAWLLALLIGVFDLFIPSWNTIFGLAIGWGIAIAVVCLVQVGLALAIDARFDDRALLALLLGPLYPLLFWLVSAFAAVRSEVTAVLKGPAEQRVVWNVPREQIDAPAKTG